MQKILIIGSGGAGKSVFARQLAKLVNIPVFHLDSYFWKPDWHPTPRDEWLKIIEDLMRKDQWILDGNYQSTLEMRIQQADTIFFLDFSRYLCLWRVLKRQLFYRNQKRPDMGEGCSERIDREFLQWIWRFPIQHRSEIYTLLKKYGDKRDIRIFRRPSHIKRFFSKLMLDLGEK